MPKINVIAHVDSKKRQPAEAIAEKGIRTKTSPAKSTFVQRRRRATTDELIASMDLDEMLEASKIVELGFRGEKIPTIESAKVRKYVGEVLRLNKRVLTKAEAKKMQQDLSVKIVEQNKKTTDAIEAKRLYHALMKEQ